MGYGTNGNNSNGTCMNTGNTLNAARPSIRLYPGVSSGGSFASFCGGAEERGHAATKIIKQLQPLRDQNTKVEPAPKPHLKQPMAVNKAPSRALDENSYANTALPEPRAQPVAVSKPSQHTGPRVEQSNTKQDSNTSLSFGGKDNNSIVRAGRRRGTHANRGAEVPEWMASKTAHRAIDCSPPTSEQEKDFPAAKPAAVANMPAMSREDFGRQFDSMPAAPAAADDGAYGIGNRVLPNRHAAKPVGGEVAAGYGIGNRNVPGMEGRIAGKRSVNCERFALQDGIGGKSQLSDSEKASMRSSAEARMKSRPF